MSPSNTHISIYNALFNFIGHLRFWGYFYLFNDLSGVKKTATLSQEWLFFVCFIVNYTFLTLFLAYLVALGLRMLACMTEREMQGYNCECRFCV